jgi:hypothetical protein
LIVVLAAGLILSASRTFAFDFYGADVSDSDVPSIYFKVGLYGIRPIVNTVAFESIAAKAGLQRGNVILSINGTDVEKSSELSQFTTNVLSVLILSGFEIKVLSFDRLAPEASKSKSIWNFKQSISQNRVVQDVPAYRITDPSVTAGNRASERDGRKSPAADAPLPQTSLEVLARDNLSSNVSLQGQLKKEKQDRTIREVAGNLSKTEDNKPSDNKVAATLLLPGAVTTKKDIFSLSIKPAYDKVTFENSKGNVSFRHSIHLKHLSKEQCMACHWTSNPTLEAIKSRLNNNRTAHSLCRGCHQKMDNAPSTECHQCHNSKIRN